MRDLIKIVRLVLAAVSINGLIHAGNPDHLQTTSYNEIFSFFRLRRYKNGSLYLFPGTLAVITFIAV